MLDQKGMYKYIGYRYKKNLKWKKKEEKTNEAVKGVINIKLWKFLNLNDVETKELNLDSGLLTEVEILSSVGAFEEGNYPRKGISRTKEKYGSIKVMDHQFNHWSPK